MNIQAAKYPGLLRSVEFDVFFVVVIPLIGIASGFLVTYDNSLFLPVLAADLWLLGYHHVVATYTRLLFDKKSFLEHRALVVYLFPAVALAVALLAIYVGAWLVATIYVYWQWWHYTRQSEGISKAYAGKATDKELGNPYIRRAAFYAVPVTGILTLSNRPSAEFLFLPFRQLPVSDGVVTAASVVTVALLIMWVVEQIKAYRVGKLAVPYVAYVISHFTVYYVAYIHLENFNYGWLAVNIWHNAQYVLFVWLYNNRRFDGKPSEDQKLLSTISQNGRSILYFATCLTLSTAIYFLIETFVADALRSVLAVSTAMIGIIIYQTLNFHHYIVDSLIWKLRKPKIRRNLGLQ